MNKQTAIELENLFSEIIGKENTITGDKAKHYGKDCCDFFPANNSLVLFPRSTEQVRDVVLAANEHNIALVPSGGRTGLSGGASASQGEVVVALDKLNKINGFNPIEQTVICGAGVITQTLQNFAQDQGLLYPVDFASSGSSQIGGNISTNAGGINVVRYGMTRDWVLGLTVVAGSGEVLELNHGLQKNNTGYDLRHLFIGAEGTLGFITEACIKLSKPEKDTRVILFAVPDLNKVMEIFSLFQQQLTLNAFEFFSDKALAKLLLHTDIRSPFTEHSSFYVLLEIDVQHSAIEEVTFELSSQCLESGLAIDCVISQSLEQNKQLWRLREDISATIARYQPYKNDLSVTVAKVPDFLADISQTVEADYPDFEVIWYGHIGDGNLHLNILKPDTMTLENFQKQCNTVSEKIMAIVKQYKGSISAEHGVGLLKKNFLHYSRSNAEISYMKQIKQIFDPNNIMNPGKIFD